VWVMERAVRAEGERANYIFTAGARARSNKSVRAHWTLLLSKCRKEFS
jgi:hypothetical protein